MHRDAAAWSGMALGSAADWSRLGPLGFVEICGDRIAGCWRRWAPSCSLMHAGCSALAVAVARETIGGPTVGRARLFQSLLHAFAMAAGMAGADLAAPSLPGSLSPDLALLMMSGGMIAGMIAARGLSAVANAGRWDFRSMIRMGG